MQPYSSEFKEAGLECVLSGKTVLFPKSLPKDILSALVRESFYKCEIQFSHEQGRLRRTRTVFNPISLSSSESRPRYLSKEAFYDLPVLSRSTHFHSS